MDTARVVFWVSASGEVGGLARHRLALLGKTIGAGVKLEQGLELIERAEFGAVTDC